MAIKMTAEMKKYRAESDAYTLIQAEGIKADTERTKMAMESVNLLKANKERELKTINKLTSRNYYNKPGGRK